MPVRLIFALLFALLLAACGGAPSDDTQPEEAAATADVDDSISPILEERAEPDDNITSTPDPRDPNPMGVDIVPLTPTREDAVGALPVARPGELVASETEDPNAALVFDTLRVTRTGGPVEGDNIELNIRQDGTFTRNGAPGLLPPEQITEIDGWLDEINFFGLQGTFMGAGAPNDAYFYTISVVRGPFSRSITAVDRFLPDELRQLLLDLLAIGA